MALVAEELALVESTIVVCENALAMESVEAPFSIIDETMGPMLMPIAMLHPIFEFALVTSLIRPVHLAFAAAIVVPFAFVFFTVRPEFFTVPLFNSHIKIASVARASSVI